MSAAALLIHLEPPTGAPALYDYRGRVALSLVPPPQPRTAQRPATTTAFELANELVTWLDTREMTEPDSPERAECDLMAERFAAQLEGKGDAIGCMLAHMESQVVAAADAIKLFQKRKKHFESAVESLEDYTIKVLDKLPKPKRGRQKVEGGLFTLTLRASDRVKLLDESKIPLEYKSVTVTLPAPTWQLNVDLHPQILEFVTKQEYSTRKEDVKSALKAGAVIDGADIEYCNTLVVK